MLAVPLLGLTVQPLKLANVGVLGRPDDESDEMEEDDEDSEGSEAPNSTLAGDNQVTSVTGDQAQIKRLRKRVYTLSRELASVMRERDAAFAHTGTVGWPKSGSVPQTGHLGAVTGPIPSALLPDQAQALSAQLSSLRVMARPQRPGFTKGSSDTGLISAVPAPLLQYLPAVHHMTPPPLGVAPYLAQAQAMFSSMAGQVPSPGPWRYHGPRRARARSLPGSRYGFPAKHGHKRNRRYLGGALRGSWSGPLGDQGLGPREVRGRSPLARPEWVDSTSRSALAAALEGEKLKQRLVAAQRVRPRAPGTFLSMPVREPSSCSLRSVFFPSVL